MIAQELIVFVQKYEVIQQSKGHIVTLATFQEDVKSRIAQHR